MAQVLLQEMREKERRPLRAVMATPLTLKVLDGLLHPVHGVGRRHIQGDRPTLQPQRRTRGIETGIRSTRQNAENLVLNMCTAVQRLTLKKTLLCGDLQDPTENAVPDRVPLHDTMVYCCVLEATPQTCRPAAARSEDESRKKRSWRAHESATSHELLVRLSYSTEQERCVGGD